MKHIQTFYLYDDRVDIILTDGNIMTIYFDENSGKAFFRYKINTVSGIKHPGIRIGKDAYGTEYFAHNHYHYGKPIIETKDLFSKGEEIFAYSEYATNLPLVVIEKALNGVLNGESYTALSFNCQTFVNDALSNRRRSPAVENIGGLIFVGLLLALFGAASSK